jgi:hypothetical protein
MGLVTYDIQVGDMVSTTPCKLYSAGGFMSCFWRVILARDLQQAWNSALYT